MKRPTIVHRTIDGYTNGKQSRLVSVIGRNGVVCGQRVGLLVVVISTDNKETIERILLIQR